MDERTLVELWGWMGMPPQLLALAPAIQERPRRCPGCRQSMRYVQLLTVKLDHCPACGVWFDGQELDLDHAGDRTGQHRVILIEAPPPVERAELDDGFRSR